MGKLRNGGRKERKREKEDNEVEEKMGEDKEANRRKNRGKVR